MLNHQKIEILDSTLREGEQTPGVSFSVKQKIAMIKRLDAFGMDFIELGHPVVSPDVYEAVETLNDLELHAKKMAHGRASKSDINDVATIEFETQIQCNKIRSIKAYRNMCEVW